MTVNGTNGDDIIDVLGDGTSVAVVGPCRAINVTNSEGADDTLVVNARCGNDTHQCLDAAAGIMKLTLDGGAGNDNMLGSHGADMLLGGDGNDFIDGNQGNDIALLGAGDDTFQWDPGDGSDIVEGQDGIDTMLFNGANVGENIDLSANGGRRACSSRRRQHHDGHQRRRARRLPRPWRRGQRSWSATSAGRT